MKIYIICYIHLTNPMFGKNLVHDVWAKMFLSGFFKSNMSLEQSSEIADFCMLIQIHGN